MGVKSVITTPSARQVLDGRGFREIAGLAWSGHGRIVRADGAGLPPGRGSVAQGRALYAARCQACHGANGTESTAPRLAGGQDTLATRAPVLTVGSYWPYATTLFDYIHRAMPLDGPQSLTPDEVYAVTAHTLHLNGIVGADAVLDAASLAAVRMPNRDGFRPVSK